MSKPKYCSFSKEQMKIFIDKSYSMEDVLIQMEYSKPNDKRIIQSIRNYCDTLQIEHKHLPDILNTNIIKCNICGEEKDIAHYYFTQGKLGQKVCKECVRKRQKEKHKTQKDFLNEYKERYGCAKCGCKKYYLIDFHHKDPKEKDFTIAQATNTKIDTILKEIDKCVCLCANCHREFHFLEKEKNLTIEQYLGYDNV